MENMFRIVRSENNKLFHFTYTNWTEARLGSWVSCQWLNEKSIENLFVVFAISPGWKNFVRVFFLTPVSSCQPRRISTSKRFSDQYLRCVQSLLYVFVFYVRSGTDTPRHTTETCTIFFSLHLSPPHAIYARPIDRTGTYYLRVPK